MKHILVLLTILFSIVNSNAQVVNIEKKRMDTTKTLQGTMDFSFDFTKNNNEILQGANSIKLQYFSGKNLFLFFNSISLVKVDSKSYMDDGFAHIRYNRELPAQWLLLEAFSQFQYNGAQNLERRLLAGAGPRIRIVDTTKTRLFFGPLCMYEIEKRTELGQTEKIRLSTYLSFFKKITKQVSLESVVYYQPNIEDFDDYRIAGEATLGVKLSKKIGIKIIYQHTFDALPPEGINRLNYALKNALSITF